MPCVVGRKCRKFPEFFDGDSSSIFNTGPKMNHRSCVTLVDSERGCISGTNPYWKLCLAIGVQL